MMKGKRKRFYNAWNFLIDYFLLHLLSMSKIIFTSLLRVLETLYNLQTSRHISSLDMLGSFLYILATGAKVSLCRERFQKSGATISRFFAIVLEKVSRMTINLIAPEDHFLAQYSNKYVMVLYICRILRIA
ncbi:hypothetical protein Gotur_024985 [Gossypium turneri]